MGDLLASARLYVHTIGFKEDFFSILQTLVLIGGLAHEQAAHTVWCVTHSLELSQSLWDTCIGPIPECCRQGVFISCPTCLPALNVFFEVLLAVGLLASDLSTRS